MSLNKYKSEPKTWENSYTIRQIYEHYQELKRLEDELKQLRPNSTRYNRVHFYINQNKRLINANIDLLELYGGPKYERLNIIPLDLGISAKKDSETESANTMVGANNYNKYLKYKNKYLSLKKDI